MDITNIIGALRKLQLQYDLLVTAHDTYTLITGTFQTIVGVPLVKVTVNFTLTSTRFYMNNKNRKLSYFGFLRLIVAQRELTRKLQNRVGHGQINLAS